MDVTQESQFEKNDPTISPQAIGSAVPVSSPLPLSLGERRVRTQFNPSNNGYVDQLKQKSADLINAINDCQPNPKIDEAAFGEFKRLMSLAMTKIEEGAMWAVKMATL